MTQNDNDEAKRPDNPPENCLECGKPHIAVLSDYDWGSSVEEGEVCKSKMEYWAWYFVHDS